MSDTPAPRREDLLRQARAYAESCRAAGIEWLPLGEAMEQEEQPASSASLAPAPTQEAAPVFDLLEPVAPAPSLTLEQRRQELTLLAEKVSACTRCSALAKTRTQTVFGDGQPGAELCFIGEAPGEDEDAQGVPFVGQAGQLLNRMIAAMGMKRENVYICNILRCRPPGNRTPQADEAGNCREFLERQLELVAPKYICTLGSCAAQHLLGTTLSVGRLRGKFHNYRGIPVLCTYHPAYLLPHRSPEKKRDVWEDLKILLARMGRAVPASRK
jgi:uracil-DNA glycosylase family 4